MVCGCGSTKKPKGRRCPWDTSRIAAPFVFFERAADAPAPALAADRIDAMRSRPLQDLGAHDAYAAAIERDTLQGYQEFLVAYPNDPLAGRVRALLAARREALTWRRTYSVDTPDAYWSYLDRYPRGPHAADARRRLSTLAAADEPPPSFSPIVYDVPPPPPAGDRLRRSASACLQRSGFRFPAAATDCLPKSAAGLSCLRAAAAARRAVCAPGACVRAGAALDQSARLRRRACKQRHLQQHSQHDDHQQQSERAQSGWAGQGRDWRWRGGRCRGGCRRRCDCRASCPASVRGAAGGDIWRPGSAAVEARPAGAGGAWGHPPGATPAARLPGHALPGHELPGATGRPVPGFGQRPGTVPAGQPGAVPSSQRANAGRHSPSGGGKPAHGPGHRPQNQPGTLPGAHALPGGQQLPPVPGGGSSPAKGGKPGAIRRPRRDSSA